MNLSRDRNPAVDELRPRRRQAPLPDGVTQEAGAGLTADQKGRFLGDLEGIVQEAEALLHRAGEGRSRHSSQMRSGLRATLHRARSTAADLDGSFAGQLETLGRAADDYIRHEPWPAVAAAGVLGVMLGWWLGHRRR